jgi:hypothetical protein
MMQIWGWCGRNRVIETWRRWETQKMWWDGGGHNLVWKWSGPRCSDIRWGGVVVLLRSYGVVCMIMRWYSDDMSEHEELFDGGGWVVYKKSVVGVGWFPFLLTLLVLLYCNASDDIETASNLVFSSFPWYQFGAPVALFLISYCSNQYHLCPTPPITISTFHNLDHVQQVWEESYAVGCMESCSMMAVIHPVSGCTFTAPSMSCMTSPTSTLLVYFFSNLGFVFCLNCNR